ncbi:MAG TPA: hypothetical protein VJV79_02870 [Polyangiaceae bacterium]|nr:hypothetical protein [Polyangiaceae bacterium]
MTFNVTVRQRVSLAYEARPAGTRKFSVQGKQGASFYRLTKRWHVLNRLIDRTNDRYREHIIDEETGDVVRNCEEPLSEHQGFGSAKYKKNKKN